MTRCNRIRQQPAVVAGGAIHRPEAGSTHLPYLGTPQPSRARGRKERKESVAHSVIVRGISKQLFRLRSSWAVSPKGEWLERG